LHPIFKANAKAFTLKACDKRTPGLFEIETIKAEMISLSNKMYCCADTSEENIKFFGEGYSAIW
jgi:hypothetical protein